MQTVNIKPVMNVIVTGTIGYDYIMDFPERFADRIMPDKIHKISLSFLVNKLSKQFGGTAGNITYSLNLLNTTPTIVAAAGNDFSPYKDFMTAKNIHTSEILVSPDEITGSYFVVTDKEDNQIGSFYVGANKFAGNLSISEVAKKKKIDMAVIAPNDPEAMKKYVKECQAINLKYVYDPAFQIENFSTEDLLTAIAGSEIFIGNDYEIGLVEKKLQLSHQDLIKKCKILVTTLGSKGSVIETSQEKLEIGCAKAREVVDPTGAGDAYRSGFVAGYLRDLPIETCGKMGATAAVYAVETYGTVNHSYSIEEFKKRYEENFGEKLLID